MPVKGLSDNALKTSIDTLNSRLADMVALKLAIKQAHWNVEGAGFIAFHELLDEVYTRAEDHSDEIAERVQILGGVAKGRAEDAVDASVVKTYPTDLKSVKDHAKALSERYADLGEAVRKDIDSVSEAGDEGTTDLLTGVSRTLDKDLWFIESHIK
ncbi:DNA starvation/stationary phase protection protein Dps [Paracoccaceae bacterium GXU_MW_L88]